MADIKLQIMDNLANGVVSMKKADELPTVLKGDFASMLVQKVSPSKLNGLALGLEDCNVTLPNLSSERSLQNVLAKLPAINVQVRLTNKPTSHYQFKRCRINV